jgi:hypothetical protein
MVADQLQVRDSVYGGVLGARGGVNKVALEQKAASWAFLLHIPVMTAIFP